MKITKEGIAVIENDTHISKWVEESGRLDHDQNMLPLVLKYINEGDTVIDCGAFIGDHTIAYVNKVGKKGRVIAFEPNEEAFDCLLVNMNGKNAICSSSVISDKNGEFYHVQSNPNVGASTAEFGGTVPSVRIDDLELKRCDFIKLDIEGFEAMALTGAVKTISRFHPTMLIEINNSALKKQGFIPDDIFLFFKGKDYTIQNIYQEQKMEGEQFDVICVHKSRLK